MTKQEQSVPQEPRAAEAKLAAIFVATRHNFPTANIQTMLAEIERGYESDANPKTD